MKEMIELQLPTQIEPDKRSKAGARKIRSDQCFCCGDKTKPLIQVELWFAENRTTSRRICRKCRVFFETPADRETDAL